MKPENKLLFWAPRLICIVAILFVSMFALDSFGPAYSFLRQLANFLIHLVPSFILAAILIIAWKWENAGGIILLIVGLAFGALVFRINYLRLHSVIKGLEIAAMICLPFVISGILFIMSHIDKKRIQRASGPENQ